MGDNGFFPDHIEPDETIHRFSVNGRRDRSAWYWMSSDANGGAYGDWRGDVTITWSAIEPSTMSSAERKAFQSRKKKAKEERERLRKEAQAKAAKKAKSIWDKAVPATAENAYLKSKGLKSYGDIKQFGKALVVPVRGLDGQLRSLQFIGPDGGKRFLTDGRIQGGCSWIKGDGRTLVAEGWATAAALHVATGCSVISCFNAGNLGPVVDALLKSKPGIEITLCADNDQWLDANVGIEKAQAVAKKHGLKMAIPTFNDLSTRPTDFDDLRRLEGIEEVKRQVEAAGALEEKWEKPILLDEYQVPAFDVSLPGILGQTCKAVSAATETPIELAVGDCLATVATAVHGKIIVRVKVGYTEPLNIWIATFLEPGNRKTAVLILTTKPLITWEAAKREKEKPRIQAIESERKSQDARIKSLRAQYGKASSEELEEIQHEIRKVEDDMVDVPVYAKVWADDITPEHFGTLLGLHWYMAIISSEGGIIETMAGRYNGGIPNLDIFLKSHAGDPVRVDRGSRDPVDIPNPASTFGLSPQPDVLKSMAEKKGFRGRGLLGRFLYFLPKSNLGNRTLETEPIHEAVSNRWEGLIHTLLDIEPQKNDTDHVEPFVIDLSRAAYSEWFEFAKVVESDMGEGGRFETMRDWAGKLPGGAARLAGLLHCVKHPQQPWAEKISVETMQQALDLGAVFASHAEIAFEMMGADVAIEGAKKVWRWVEKGRHEVFTRSDCFQALRGTFKRVADIETPLDVLEERNYLASYDPKKGSKGRSSITYSVNPELTNRWM